MKVSRLLIIEDDVTSVKLLTRVLESAGYHVDYTLNGEEALALVQEVDYDLFLIDMILPGIDGLETLRRLKSSSPDTLAVVITAYGSITAAVNALKAGANDFLEKPVVPEKLLLVISRIFEERRLKREIGILKADLQERYKFGNIIGKHWRMQRVFELIESLNKSDAPVLITGETGTGKDLVARAIHFGSGRKQGPFVALNCAAVPETLLESELFGHERGAFTGAFRRKEGKLELANGGTLFLDEVGDMSNALQSKLLRTLQDKKIERVGGNATISLDTRVVAATNKELPEEIAAGRFRLDLYYRLNVVPVHLPPLRERQEDIPLLVEHFLRRLCMAGDRPKPKLSPKALASLMNHSWPGNVRELENVLERALVLSRNEVIEEISFGATGLQSGHSGEAKFPGFNSDLPLALAKDRVIEQLEREYLSTVLEKHKGSVSLTAAQAQVDVRTIRRKMKQYGLDKATYK
jgi:DNA-binding NtrC family response regulator